MDSIVMMSCVETFFAAVRASVTPLNTDTYLNTSTYSTTMNIYTLLNYFITKGILL